MTAIDRFNCTAYLCKEKTAKHLGWHWESLEHSNCSLLRMACTAKKQQQKVQQTYANNSTNLHWNIYHTLGHPSTVFIDVHCLDRVGWRDTNKFKHS